MAVSINSSVKIESEKIEKELESKPINFSYNDKKIQTTLSELGLKLKVNQIETTSNKLTNLASLLTKQKNYDYNFEIINQDSETHAALLNLYGLKQNAIEPRLSLINEEYIIETGQVGYQINNIPELTLNILNTIQLSESVPLILSVNEIKPSVTNAQLYDFSNKLKSFESKNLKFESKDGLYYKSITLSNLDLSIDPNQKFSISDKSFQEIIADLRFDLEQDKQDFIINEINTENNQILAEGDLKDGIKINEVELRALLNQSINSTKEIISVPLTTLPSKVINNHNSDVYTLLGSGSSNYAGSGAGRVHNIQFASDSRYKTIYVPQGETFKFNSYLGGPVSISRGWKNAYIISGGEIVPAPGGGICQMSTTFYRAALNSGLQIDKKSNHSLYVSYYTAYGDGLDAAIFPGSKDLHFTNNTPSNIILHSYYNEYTQDLTVNVLGKSDGRQTELFGPFTAGDNDTNPFNLSTRTNQINWIRQITDSNGKQSEEVLTSTYSRFYRN
jgi:vancomycin resistance protein YoaR